MRVFVLFALLYSVYPTALWCYNDVKEGTMEPRDTVSCLNNSYFCTSVIITIWKRTVTTYGCDSDMNRKCKKSECFEDNFNQTVCCCSKDYCNNASLRS